MSIPRVLPGIGLWAVILAGCLVPSGCTGGRAATGSLGSASADSRFGPGSLTVSEVQSQVMSFTDTFIGAASEQWNQVEQAALIATGPPMPGERDAEQAALAAHEIKLSNVAAAVSIATRPNPIVAAADLITLTTLQRRALEDPWAAEMFGAQVAASLAGVYREQEEAARRIGVGVFFPAQENELLALIDTWRSEHPDRHFVSGVRMEDFGRDRQQTMIDDTGAPAGLFALVNLDTATKEVEKSRMLGERVFFYAEHLPTIMRWQAQSVYLGMFRTPQAMRTVASLAGVSEAAAKIALTADRLPEELTAERKATLAQLFEGLTDQRTEVLKEIDASQGRLQGSLKELRDAVQATDALAVKITEAIRAADAIAARFAPSAGAPAGAPGRDVLAEYKSAAEQTSETAQRLTTLTQRIESLLASPALTGTGVQGTVASFQQSAQQVVDHAFWKMLILLCVAPMVVVVSLGLTRRVAKWSGGKKAM